MKTKVIGQELMDLDWGEAEFRRRVAEKLKRQTSSSLRNSGIVPRF